MSVPGSNPDSVRIWKPLHIPKVGNPPVAFLMTSLAVIGMPNINTEDSQYSFIYLIPLLFQFYHFHNSLYYVLYVL